MNRRAALKLLSALPAAATVEVLNAEPGDVLVLTAPGHISDETATQLKRHAETAFPGYKFMVLGDGLKLSVLKKP
jgi:hypothetical protein